MYENGNHELYIVNGKSSRSVQSAKATCCAPLGKNRFNIIQINALQYIL